MRAATQPCRPRLHRVPFVVGYLGLLQDLPEQDDADIASMWVRNSDRPPIVAAHVEMSAARVWSVPAKACELADQDPAFGLLRQRQRPAFFSAVQQGGRVHAVDDRDVTVAVSDLDEEPLMQNVTEALHAFFS